MLRAAGSGRRCGGWGSVAVASRHGHGRTRSADPRAARAHPRDDRGPTRAPAGELRLRQRQHRRARRGAGAPAPPRALSKRGAHGWSAGRAPQRRAPSPRRRQRRWRQVQTPIGDDCMSTESGSAPPPPNGPSTNRGKPSGGGRGNNTPAPSAPRPGGGQARGVVRPVRGALSSDHVVDRRRAFSESCTGNPDPACSLQHVAPATALGSWRGAPARELGCVP
jgi:hypothetical protein